ncbi:hypothetical protein ACLPHM_01635 [Paenalcaligenes sp. Me131]|uniref:hypothetical protein n=1 Tax=Paenalcaligenes sp. Me131 TaxID=3392636 RepID=UPI003D2714EA
MKKRVLVLALPAALLVSGCGSMGDGSDGSFLSALQRFSTLLDGTTPFVEEAEEWKQYSITKTAQGVTYTTATTSDTQFVVRKMDTEYVAAIDRLSRPFAISESAKKELDEANKGYQFTYNQIRAVKDKTTSNTIGYCINYDVNRHENGQPTPLNAPGNVQQGFLYVAKDKPVSATTSNIEFIKRMCTEDFYNRYKNPNY